MKRIWMRVGIDTEITDEEYAELMEATGGKTGYRDHQKLEELFKKMIERGKPSGESYILGKDDAWGLSEYDNPQEEISVDL